MFMYQQKPRVGVILGLLFALLIAATALAAASFSNESYTNNGSAWVFTGDVVFTGGHKSICMDYTVGSDATAVLGCTVTSGSYECVLDNSLVTASTTFQVFATTANTCNNPSQGSDVPGQSGTLPPSTVTLAGLRAADAMPAVWGVFVLALLALGAVSVRSWVKFPR